LGIGDWGLGIGPNPQSPIPNFIQDLSKDQEAHAKNEQKGILDCKANNKVDKDIKECLKKCLVNSTNSFSTMYDRIDEKLNEVSKKL
jgi:uncharacterized membrane-anchored protein YjiN (DUF445 family)